MDIKKARQILKTVSDETRMRVINLLSSGPLNVAEICEILELNQSIVSKHLTHLRLTRLVNDKRDGQFVYYHLIEPEDIFAKEVLDCITAGGAEIDVFKQDLEKARFLKYKN